MREIKFRAWHKVQKRMFNVEAIAIDKRFVMDDGVKWDFELVDLMEFTGFKDAKGKPIFEGDLIRIDYEDGPTRGVVEFCDGFFGFNVEAEVDRHPEHFSPFHENDKPIVIANVYETKSRVKRSKKNPSG
jgi:uncharacterized phage protein (TIGR01671 family)